MISVSQQTLVFLQSCVLGAVLGLVYDLFRISRIAIKPNAIISFIQDLIFFIICTIFSFAFILISADGQLRAFLIIGEVLGAVLYFFTLSVLLIGLAKPIIAFIKRVFRFIYNITINPIKRVFGFLCKKLKDFVGAMTKRAKRIKNNNKNSLKTNASMVYNQNNVISNKNEVKKRRAKKSSKSKKEQNN